MGNIQNALKTFTKILDYKYKFIAGRKKQLHSIELLFKEKDFRHMAGLHYLKDIDIPQNPIELFSKIRNNEISDDYLSKSAFYQKVSNNYVNVKNRIYGLQFLELFIDNRNLICQYIKNMNVYSQINADYLIDSSFNFLKAYIFICKRTNTSGYCICSFFIKPQSIYQGITIHWLYKSKIHIPTQKEYILYENPRYTPICKQKAAAP